MLLQIKARAGTFDVGLEFQIKTSSPSTDEGLTRQWFEGIIDTLELGVVEIGDDMCEMMVTHDSSADEKDNTLFIEMFPSYWVLRSGCGKRTVSAFSRSQVIQRVLHLIK